MLLNIEHVKKSFAETEVLRDISLHVEEGEFVALLGPSGSGKSTIFNLIGGIMEPDDGAITLNHKVIHGKRGLIGYMPQQPSLFPWRTVLENIVLVQELTGKPNRQEAKEWLEKVGLQEFENAYPIELSGGMKQRVAFIRAMLSKQNLLCLDEPFSALDEFTRISMQKWLLSVWETNRKSILFVTHSIEEALFLADRIYILTKRPTMVKEEVIVPFARPRDESLLNTEPFFHLKQKIFKQLKDELDEGL
ncbi:ABC transporter ATP-binding protein [Rummeliibacillus sp. SL167]|uniref:ABC transporter ATP-binding protein n=1 Tax=Rummeliibacillus sp. SL167 TaxID=2579792 RepID=UPI0011B65A84|nr:ABC transporter ATP-binding protein [Rummeliibacillus sp. SL167]